MDAELVNTELRQELRRDFGEFLDHDFSREAGGKYAQKIDSIIKQYTKTKSVRLDVDLQDLSDYNADLHRRVMTNPIDCIPAFEEALEEHIRNQDSKLMEDNQLCHVSFSGEFGANSVSPRALSSHLLNHLVQINGIVTRCTLVKPKIAKSVHYCPATESFSNRIYRDATSLNGPPTASVWPTHDEQGNPLVSQFGLCHFVNEQTVTIQELPENAPPGQLPRSVEVVLQDDLRDACKPGDRVQIVGIYRPLPPRANGGINGVFRALVIANGVRHMSQDATGPTFTEEDYDNITTLAGEPDVMEQLASSLAPSIYGYSYIKKALLLLLVGGRERVLANGTHLRGDVNCLMVGDPGVAKSQLLRAVMGIAPLCVSTTGRGSSGVGLTAAVVTDQDTGERRLEAGAMVLADRGIVCIDEFDKMSDADRVAIHEVMEQQTVTIAKAGIMTQLNARCSVVAAANPIYGHYDRTISITRNIGLPDSLLSRFDLLFVVLDNNDAARDRELAEHVLGQHRYRAAGDEGLVEDRLVDSLEEEDENGNKGATAMRVKYDARLYGPRTPGQKEPLSIPFLKKYIAFAKQRFAAPDLTPEAGDAIAEYYAELRNTNEVKALPVTVRTLETLIRLSCAHAKLRLSAYVEAIDVEEACSLLDIILKSDPSAQQAPRNARRKEDSRTKRGRDDNDDNDDDNQNDDDDGAAPMDADNNNGANDDDEEEDISEDEDAAVPEAGAGPSSPGSRDVISRTVMSLCHEGVATVTALMAVLASKGVKVPRSEVMEFLNELKEADKIMLEGEDIYLSS